MHQIHLTPLIEELQRRSLHIATAESCTLGHLAATLGSLSGALSYLQGGIIAYHPDLKTSLLGVPPELIDTYHVVSEEVACAMALGAMEQLQAEVAIATTGVAGPTGGDATHPVGTICLAVVFEGPRGPVVNSTTLHLSGSREENIDQAIHEALHLTLQLLEAHPEQ